jgi:uncharacterized membrane protein
LTPAASSARGPELPGIERASSVRLRPAAALVLAAATGAAAWYLALLLGRLDGAASHGYDLAFFQQLVWNLANGNGLVSSFEPGNFLGLHFSPLLIFPAAIEAVSPDVRVLTTLHVMGLAAMGPAAYVFVSQILRPARAARIVAAALTAPIPFWALTQRAAVADFHTEAIAIPLAMLSGWAGLSARMGWMWLLAVAALLAKEDQAWSVAVVGLVVGLRARAGAPRIRRHAAALVGVSLVYAILIVAIVMPAIRAATDGTTLIGDYYGWLPDAVRAGGPVAAGEAIVRTIARPDGWARAGGAVLSGAALGLLRPHWLLVLVPPVLLNLLSVHEPQPALGLHYGLSLVVPTVVVTAIGARRLLAIAVPRRSRLGVSRWAWLLAAPAVVVAVVQSPLPPALIPGGPFMRPPAREQVAEAAAVIPAAAPVAADDGLAALVANRRSLTLLGTPIPSTAYVIADRLPSIPGYVDRERREASLQVIARERPLLYDDGRFRVWGPLDG